jgi:hypothetical protein
MSNFIIQETRHFNVTALPTRDATSANVEQRGELAASLMPVGD